MNCEPWSVLKYRAHEQHHEERRNNSPDAALVKRQQRESRGADLRKDDGADEVAGDDEEYVDADEAAVQLAGCKMEATTRRTATARKLSMSGR